MFNKLKLGGKAFLLSLMMGSSAYSIAQASESVMYHPDRANGFLILNELKYPDVVHWKIEIETRSLDTVNEVFVYTTQETLNLYGTNFIKIDEEYITDNVYMEIVGIDDNEDDVVTDGPVAICPGCENVVLCESGCEGDTYAYGLPLWTMANGQVHYGMRNIYPDNGYPHYYQWVDGDDWTSFTSGVSPVYYGLASNVGTPNWQPWSYYGDLVIQLSGVLSTEGLEDAQGNPCTGLVYGVRKSYGPWQGAYGSLVSNPLASSSTMCLQTFNFAKNTVNNNTQQFTTYNVPYLACDGESFASYEEKPAPIDNPVVDDFLPCIENIDDAGIDEDGLYTILGQINCDFASSNNLNGFVWPEELKAVTYKPLNPIEGVAPVVLTEEDLFDEDGYFIGPNVTFHTGLNELGFQFSDNSYASSFFDTQDSVISQLEQKDFLSVLAYPVPIVENGFNIDYTATARVSFTYTLLDSELNVLFEKEYTIGKDVSVTDEITVEEGIPTGILFNKFTFSDDSQTVFQTIK